MRKFTIEYRIGRKCLVVVQEGFDKAQAQVADIMNAGGEVVKIREQVKIREIIDYTLSRKGSRQYIVVNGDGEVVKEGGNWKTMSACKAQIERFSLDFMGVETVNQNYKHWADFKPVKGGKMADDGEI